MATKVYSFSAAQLLERLGFPASAEVWQCTWLKPTSPIIEIRVEEDEKNPKEICPICGPECKGEHD